MLLAYLTLSVGLTWPLVRNFRTRLIGVGMGDVYHSVWMLWHTLEWVIGKQPLFSAPYLYAPHGISTLTDSVGPIPGLMALPFWLWGPNAAYNGAILVGVCLSGYCMYLLARALDFVPGVAFFAGVVFQVTPAHLAGVFGHLEKTFIGILPLTVLSMRFALDPTRRYPWIAVAAVTLLGAGLYSGYQFIYAALAAAFFSLAALFTADRKTRPVVLCRVLLTFGASIILVGPLVYAILRVSHDPALDAGVRVNVTSPYYTPDVSQFFLPSYYQVGYRLIQPHLADLHLNAIPPGAPNNWIGPSVETAVTLPLTGLFLCLVALVRGPSRARIWILLAFLTIVLMLGPYLRVWGHTQFTAFRVPIVLPYAFLDSLPGLEFMRAPGRFQMLAGIGFAIGAAYGLAHLVARWHRYRIALMAGACVLLLIESWPVPWQQAPLPRIPVFYQQIGHDSERYAVLDLPAASGSSPCPGCWPNFAATYQMYQMAHHKSIAWGYFSHTFLAHPLPLLNYYLTNGLTAPDAIRVDGNTANPFADAQTELSHAGYRYVVWHKTLMRQLAGKMDDRSTPAFIEAVFGPNARPFIDDDLVRVYRIDPRAITQPTVRLGTNWRSASSFPAWAASPATLTVGARRAGRADLVILPVAMHDPHAVGGIGTTGILNVRVGDHVTPVPIVANHAVTVPLMLETGDQTVTLSLEAGNFQPSAYGAPDASVLSFAVGLIDLRTAGSTEG